MDSDAESWRAEVVAPCAIDQSRLFDLLGKINYVVLQGNALYLQACGMVYRIHYGAYWQSVFSGEQHWELRCEEVSEGIWAKGHETAKLVGLPLRYTRRGWVIEVESLPCLLYGDLLAINQVVNGKW